MAGLLEWNPELSDQDVRQLGKLRPGRCHRTALKLKITPHLPCRYGTTGSGSRGESVLPTLDLPVLPTCHTLIGTASF
jgi:hypothetical protein